ncbi:hypothetical protein ACF1BE_19890 [Streptomyces sp. NPDC014991]|uniref:hypothetical protein n=1 Tax=Streptomyces sp. NPDC014991 TaxID=3364935 RepID=UPI0036FC13CF
MARRLRGFVHVDGKWFGPDTEVPADTAKRIGDHAWETDADSSDDGEPGPVGYTDPGTGGDEAPPRAGRGSGIDAWRKFAEQRGVEYDTNASREDIIAACEAAGVIEREE